MRRILLPITVAAFGVSLGFSQELTDGDWSYIVNTNNEATITQYSGPGGHVVIPASVNGYPVRTLGLGDARGPIFGFDDRSVTSVIIPDSVSNIGEIAFGFCINLASVTIPGSVISIGNSAFANCTALTDLIIPDGVTAIGLLAFAGCTSLVSVTIPGTVKEIGNGAFQECSSLTNVTLGSGLEFIGRTMFRYCPSLETITIPTSVTNVQAFAFRDCVMLTNVVLPSGLLRLAEQAFSGTALRDVSVPDSVLSIGADCFIDAPITNSTIPGKFIAQFGSIGLPPEVSKDLLLDALTNEFGIATTNDLSAATNNAIAQVQASPNDYDLYSETQYNANRITGVAQGKSEVTNNPAAYNLFTESSIMDLRMNGTMVQKQGSTATFVLQPQTTTDLATQPFTNNGTAITNEIALPGDKGFLRIQAKPE